LELKPSNVPNVAFIKAKFHLECSSNAVVDSTSDITRLAEQEVNLSDVNITCFKNFFYIFQFLLLSLLFFWFRSRLS